MELLYKYRSLENFKFFVDILLNNRLYAAQFKDLNDPMEGYYYYRLNKSEQKRFNEENLYLRICSLSRKNDDELMWSHYAQGQRGVAIGVKTFDLQKKIIPVQYNGFPEISFPNINLETVKEIFSHKLPAWHYEEEVRIFLQRRMYFKVSIEEVITGRAMNTRDYSLITDLVKKINPNIKIIKAETFMNI